MSKKLINDAASCVNDAVEGLLLTDARLMRVGNLNILVRQDILQVRDTNVSIISGGGSGHEPAHAGFVGEGMLSGAVLGNVFASPSVSAILAAIRVCGGKKGVLLVVKNYTGDRLNFGMAMEKAKQEGIACQMVIVDDDCALQKGKGITGGRGVAGTVFVHKVAGAASAAGLSLEQVHKEASDAVQCVGTMGIALSTCTVPGAPTSQRLAGARVYEVGMGIHGEPGREQRELPESEAATVVGGLMVEGILGDGQALAPRLDAQPGEAIVVLLNNLGSLPGIEMAIVTRAVMLNILQRGFRPVRAFVGPYMTALEMTGVSLTLVRIQHTPEGAMLLNRIDAPTHAPAWTPSSPLTPSTSSSAYLTSRSLAYDESAGLGSGSRRTSGGFPCALALVVVRAVCERVIAIEPTITEYDTVCGDGDCGLVMKAGATRILADIVNDQSILQLCQQDSAILCDRLADAISASMGGTSGALLEIFFRAMAGHMTTISTTPSSAQQAVEWSAAMWKGLEAIKFYGGATVGMRTMLDALEPGLQVLQLPWQANSLATSAAAAKHGMESTKTMGSLAGRSNYVEQQRMMNIPDPGAAVIAEAFAVAEKTINTDV